MSTEEETRSKVHDVDRAGETEDGSQGAVATGLRRWLPVMERQERQELFERIEADSTGGRDYYVMMALSTTLASLGLLQDSTAVVIGAMLVAPLMGPLAGAGLALVQGNLKLMRSALVVLLLGIGLALVLAGGFGAINPGYEPTMEVEARGTPDILDLFIALTSGMIAAYALCRPALSNSIAGVAIAAALVPPLAVVGIATAAGEHSIAALASILLATNIVSIILGTALVFRIMGVYSKREDDDRRWVRRTVVALGFFVVLLAATLSIEGIEQSLAGQRRPATYPLSLPVRKSVAQFLDQYPGVQMITMGRDSVEPLAGTTVILATREPISAGFRQGLREQIAAAREHSLLEGILPERKTEPISVYLLLEAPHETDMSAPSSPDAS